ncbi:MAG: hypothetical protein FWC01_07515, partial [Treponema sp.]|nr:hypothetical protein [Treponema sp.]MCL2237709.1 hypothetical protein [Treponema sp.]
PSLAADSRFNRIVLAASADQDSKELFWFVNAQFLGKVQSGERLLWTPEAGNWNISVIDSLGRSSGVNINVEMSFD